MMTPVPARLAASPARAPLRPRWVVADPPDPAVVDRLVAELRLPRTLCDLLARRGHSEPEAAKAFLRPHPGQIHPPLGLAGMTVAVERVLRAIGAGETILVHGDYDVDGICATVILCRALGMMGGRAVPFVPHRIGDGYDLTEAGIRAAERVGATLIVTADCGIVAHAAVETATSRGIDVIVTDHHAPGEVIPPAVAVVNPNRRDCPYPDKGLAGATVAYKLAVAVAEAAGFAPDRLHALLDLVAVASIADLAPVTAENRALLRWGISILRSSPNPGMRALIRVSGLAEKDEINAGRIGFILAPWLNAAGRMGDAMRGVRLLLTDDHAEAERLAGDLESENRRRRELDQATLDDALRILDEVYDPSRDFGVVLASPEWHPGVIGIVASRVVERIHRPTVLIALGDGEGKGSARSVRGFHLHQAFVACSRHLLRFGGHAAAAGCSILPDEVDAFRESFNTAARERLGEEQLVPRIDIAVELSLGEVTHDLYRMLRHFEPFGIGNATPVFAARGARLEKAPRLVGDQSRHLRLTLGDDGVVLPAIGFNMADRLREIGGVGSRVDIAFKVDEDVWKRSGPRDNGPGVQAKLVDVRAAAG